MGVVSVHDETTKLVGHRFLNSQICLSIGLLQGFVCIWGIAQHVRSFVVEGKLLQCDFDNGTLPLEAADAVIFDVGLFSIIWGINGCVAEYIDGGKGRLVWCISHVLSLVVSLPWAFVRRPRPYFLWPLLIQQSLYGIGLLILLLSATPRILPLLAEPHAAPLPALAFYILGTSLNFFLLYIAWHWYWHIEALWGSAVRVRFGEVLRNANNRSRRDKPMIPKEPMVFPPPVSPVTISPVKTPDKQEEAEEEDPEDPYPGPIIVATRLYPEDIENIHLRAQAHRKRRLLPPTPQSPPKLIFPPSYSRMTRSQL